MTEKLVKKFGLNRDEQICLVDHNFCKFLIFSCAAYALDKSLP